MSRGLFITFEGIEGSGKSTQALRLHDQLAGDGHRVVATREPGDTDVGKQVRAILLDPRNVMDPLTELLLYCADRAEHTARVITPALSTGKTVLCDRYSDATRAYQGLARGLGLERVRQVDLGRRDPDVTLLFDLPAVTGLARARARNDQHDLDHESRFEREELDFHEAVRAGYLALATAEPDRFRVVDAATDPDTVFAAAATALAPFLEGR